MLFRSGAGPAVEGAVLAGLTVGLLVMEKQHTFLLISTEVL